MGRNFNGAFVGELCPMTPRTKSRISFVIGSVLCQKLAKVVVK